MKKLIVSLLLLTSFSGAFASPTEEALTFDETAIQEDFDQLNKIEKFVADNQGITLEELQAENSNLVADVTLSEDTATFATAKDMPILGAFWWGCCLGIIGVALVYFITDNDKAQMKNVLIGCVINLILFGGSYGLFGAPWDWF